MIKRFIFFYVFFLFCSSFTLAQKKGIKEEVEAIVNFLNEKNSRALLALMTDSSRIGNLPPMDIQKVLPEILSNFKGVEKFDIISDMSLANGDHLVSLQVTYADGKSGKPTFQFNKLGKLVNLGIIKARLKGNPEEALTQALNATEKADTLRIPFQMENGLIYVPAELNGQQGFFMFDSGAPVLILRKKYVSVSHINKEVSVDFTGMGGTMRDVQWAVGNTLKWGGMTIEDLDAPVAAMDDMELENGVPIFGLMGYGMLKDYQLTFDYTRQELLLERVDKDGDLVGSSFKKGKYQGLFSMRMKRHIPIVDIAIGDHVYPMGIDCGANANVLKEDVAAAMNSYIDYGDENVSISGVGGVAQNNRVAYLMKAMIGSVALEDMYTVFTNQAIGGGEGDDALPIVGLLGTPFLNQNKITLNFNKGEITVY
ncbi:aspartyl protease family protein [Sphingobacterium sp. LRF_L2]|uniref:aspartyl protease family protein n=1 Tax=Sphingobacterium sp. LRF_L2 TaxID=3369421 RepID=UPI003F621274